MKRLEELQNAKLLAASSSPDPETRKPVFNKLTRISVFGHVQIVGTSNIALSASKKFLMTYINDTMYSFYFNCRTI